MFLLLTGSRGTACAKFVVLIVSVVVAEIKLDLGPISYTRQKISQERCRKCPLWVSRVASTKQGRPRNARFTPIAAKHLRRSETTLRANAGHSLDISFYG